MIYKLFFFCPFELRNTNNNTNIYIYIYLCLEKDIICINFCVIGKTFSYIQYFAYVSIKGKKNIFISTDILKKKK